MIFDDLGFDMDVLDRQLAGIKEMYEKSLKPDPHTDIAAFKKQVEALQKAADKMDLAISALSPAVRANIFGNTSFHEEVRRIGKITVDASAGWEEVESEETGEMGEQKKSITRKETQALNVVVLRIAAIYQNRTGKRPTYTSNPDTGYKSGNFIEFLTACANRVGIHNTKLVRRAAALIENKKLNKPR